MLTEHTENLVGGRHCSMIIRRGVVLTLTDLSGASNVGTVSYTHLTLPTKA